MTYLIKYNSEIKTSSACAGAVLPQGGGCARSDPHFRLQRKFLRGSCGGREGGVSSPVDLRAGLWPCKVWYPQSRPWQKYRSVQILPRLWRTFTYRGAWGVPDLCVRPLDACFWGSRREPNNSSKNLLQESEMGQLCHLSPINHLLRPWQFWVWKHLQSQWETQRNLVQTPTFPSGLRTTRWSPVSATLEALPTGTVLTRKSGQHWKLGSLRTRDDQGILCEGTLFTSGRCWAGRGGAIFEPGQGEGDPFLRMGMKAISQLKTRL